MHTRARHLLIALLALVVLTASGCAGRHVKHPPSPSERTRHAYFVAMQELVVGNYARAVQLLNQVARSPEFVRYAALARLRIGDALFLQERHEEAIEAYRMFIAQHGSNPNLPYARFRIAAAYHARIPSDWFATPPAWELDQTMTKQAERELEGFLKTFSTSVYAPDARAMLVDAQQMLLDHELYVARYYEKKGQWRAVAWRLDGAIKSFPALAVTPKNVWRMARAYANAEEVGDAARGYAMYLERFPKGTRSGDARRELKKIQESLEPAPEKVPEAVEPPADPSEESEESEE